MEIIKIESKNKDNEKIEKDNKLVINKDLNTTTMDKENAIVIENSAKSVDIKVKHSNENIVDKHKLDQHRETSGKDKQIGIISEQVVDKGDVTHINK